MNRVVLKVIQGNGIVVFTAMAAFVAACADGHRKLPSSDSNSDVISDIAGDISTQDAIIDDTANDLAVQDITLMDSDDPVDGVPSDGIATDMGADGVSDVGVFDVVDGGGADGASDAVDCEPISCALFCEYGFQLDDDGCPVCACRDCNVGTDCNAVMTCSNPACSPDGACSCDCTQRVSEPTLSCGYVDVSVPYCSCTTTNGVKCNADAHYACPNVCKPGSFIDFPCPKEMVVQPSTCLCGAISRKPVCHPVCIADGSVGEGYYDSCTNTLMKAMDCANLKTPDGMVQQCPAVCGAIGSKSEGWYMGCTPHSLIVWANCAPTWDCPQDVVAGCGNDSCSVGTAATFACGTEMAPAPWCSCKPKNAQHCPPVCAFVGTKSEGWYDGCSGALIQPVPCKTCEATCDLVGTKSEGWYSTCKDGLIAWDNCSGTLGVWTCSATPWNLCGYSP